MPHPRDRRLPTLPQFFLLTSEQNGQLFSILMQWYQRLQGKHYALVYSDYISLYFIFNKIFNFLYIFDFHFVAV